MKILQYFSRDLRTAVLAVKKELGTNAVILSHHQVDNGVEVIAAIDEEYGLRPGHLPPIPYLKISKPATGSSNVIRRTETKSIETKITATKSSAPGIRKASFFNSCTGSQNKNNIVELDTSGNDSCTNWHEARHTEFNKMNSCKWQETDKHLGAELPSEPLTESEIPECNSMNKVVTKTKQTEHESLHYRSTRVVNSNTSNLIPLVEQQITEHAWGDVARKNPARAQLIRQLIKIDFHPVIIQSIADAISASGVKQQQIFEQAKALLASQLPIYKEDLTRSGGTVALFGATGVGKTSTIAKMAARFALQNGRDKVGLITTDSKRLGAKEQLDLYSRILGIPLKVVRDEIELLEALNALSDKSFVLIDTAGMGSKEIGSSKYLDLFSGAITQIKNFLVLPATAHRVVLEKNAETFKQIKLDGSIITRLDDSVSIGGPLSVSIMSKLPLAYYCDGQTIPDDFHLARAHKLADQAFNVSGQFPEAQAVEPETPVKAGKAANVSI